MTAVQASKGDRLPSVALTAKLAYLSNVPETRLCSWIERLELILEYGAAWLPPTGGRPVLDDVDLYGELENHGFPKLLALQREAGRQAALAVLVLLEVERGQRDAAFEAWNALRSFRASEIARKADRARFLRLPSMRKANAERLNRLKDRAAKDSRDAQALLAAGWPARDIASAVSRRNGRTASTVRRNQKK